MAGQGSGGNVIAALASFFHSRLGAITARSRAESRADVYFCCCAVVDFAGLDYPSLVDCRRRLIQTQ